MLPESDKAFHNVHSSKDTTVSNPKGTPGGWERELEEYCDTHMLPKPVYSMQKAKVGVSRWRYNVKIQDQVFNGLSVPHSREFWDARENAAMSALNSLRKGIIPHLVPRIAPVTKPGFSTGRETISGVSTDRVELEAPFERYEIRCVKEPGLTATSRPLAGQDAEIPPDLHARTIWGRLDINMGDLDTPRVVGPRDEDTGVDIGHYSGYIVGIPADIGECIILYT